MANKLTSESYKLKYITFSIARKRCLFPCTNTQESWSSLSVYVHFCRPRSSRYELGWTHSHQISCPRLTRCLSPAASSSLLLHSSSCAEAHQQICCQIVWAGPHASISGQGRCWHSGTHHQQNSEPCPHCLVSFLLSLRKR